MVKTQVKMKTENQVLRVGENFGFGIQVVDSGNKKESKPVITGRDLVIWVDCSGSMYSSIKMIASHVKNKVVSMLKPDDRLFLGYFSGTDQYGFLQEDVQIKDITDLKPIHNAIDKFFQAMCLTGFRQPLELTEKVLLSRQSMNRPTVLFFLSDGFDNQSRGGDSGILEVCKRLSSIVNSAVIVEYGYNCNRDLLSKMAASLGGSHIFAENFMKYEPVIEQFVQNTNVSPDKKIEVKLNDIPLYDLVWTVKDKEVLIFEPEKIMDTTLKNEYFINISPDVETIFYFTDSKNANLTRTLPDENIWRDLYAGMALLSQKGKSLDIWKILKWSGDVEFIVKFNNAFGIQNITEFETMCNEVANGNRELFRDGRNFNLIPDDNAYCILNLVNRLISGDNCFYLDHDDWNYKPIGPKTVQTSTVLTEDEEQELNSYLALLWTETDVKKVKEINDNILALKNKKAPMSFVRNDIGKKFPLNKLVWNKNRANLSVQVVYNGHVILPENNFNLPAEFPTFIIRTYSLIVDGILNIKTLPVSVDFETFTELSKNKLIKENETYSYDKIYTLDLTKLNVINNSMVKEVSAQKTFELAIGLLSLQAEAKVFKYLEEQLFPRDRSAGIQDKYGFEASEYLASLGIKDGGFSPYVKPFDSGETRRAIEFNFKIPTSTLPAIEKTIDKIGAGKKLNLAEQMIEKAYQKYLDFINDSIYLKAANKDGLLQSWLSGETKAIIDKTREVNSELARIKFALILAKSWFSDLKSRAEDTLEIKTIYGNIPVTAEYKELQVKI